MRVYKGWIIECDVGGTVINSEWIISKGRRVIWLNGTMSLDDVLKFIDKLEGGE